MNMVKFSCLVLTIFCITSIPIARNLSCLLKCAEYVATVDELYTDERTGESKIKVSCDVHTTRIIAEFSNEDNYEVGDTVYILFDEDASTVFLSGPTLLQTISIIVSFTVLACAFCALTLIVITYFSKASLNTNNKPNGGVLSEYKS